MFVDWNMITIFVKKFELFKLHPTLFHESGTVIYNVVNRGFHEKYTPEYLKILKENVKSCNQCETKTIFYQLQVCISDKVKLVLMVLLHRISYVRS